jgi:hypothetical protein
MTLCPDWDQTPSSAGFAQCIFTRFITTPIFGWNAYLNQHAVQLSVPTTRCCVLPRPPPVAGFDGTIPNR